MPETTETLDFQQARTDFVEAYAGLFALIADYPEARIDDAGACGIWSPRDVLAHLAGWLAEAQRRFPRYARGTGAMVYDDDNFNAVSVRMRHNDSWGKIVVELHQRHDVLLALADALPANRVDNDDRYAEWFDGLAEDCEEHTEELRIFADKE